MVGKHHETGDMIGSGADTLPFLESDTAFMTDEISVGGGMSNLTLSIENILSTCSGQ
jgi:hypothetical protein